MTKNVCVMGLGFVGFPMAIALANVKGKGYIKYKVFGYDNNKYKTSFLLNCINKRKLPFKSNDKILKDKYLFSCKFNKIRILKEASELKKMDVVMVSVGFDFLNKARPFENLLKLIENITLIAKKGSLILFETTLPPGTFEKILLPKIKSILKKRKFENFDVSFGYSYERIMPGQNYFLSITNNYRCFSGVDKKSSKKVEIFLKSFVNYKKFPLKKMHSITECETAKVLENSYRATNIALIDEWVKYADELNIDLLNVINAIKLRPTHSNIMLPGLGVGGYCLPKDALFAKESANKIIKKNLRFPFIDLTSKINQNMPYSSYLFIKKRIKHLKNKKILILGASYKNDIGDLRNSPSLKLKEILKRNGSKIFMHDPFLKLKDNSSERVPSFKKFNIILFCVKHKNYLNLNLKIFSKKNVYFDLNNVLKNKQINFLNKNKHKLFILGRDV